MPWPHVSCIGILSCTSSKDSVRLKVIFIPPAEEPSFVLITTTPLAALEPHSAAAEAPFNTSTEAMSLALISFILDCWVEPPVLPPVILLPPPYVVELLIGMPSTIMRG